MGKKIDQQQFVERRLSTADRVLHDAGILTDAQSLQIGDTGGTKYPCRLVIYTDPTETSGAHETPLMHAGTFTDVAAAVDVLYELAFFIERNTP